MPSPPRGRCRRKPTDEVESNPCALRTPYLFTITYYLFTCRRSLPRGSCRRKPTDEVESNPCALRTPYLFTITYYLFTCRRSLLRGRCRRKPTDEAESNPCALRTPYLFTITYYLFTCRRSLPRGRCRRSRRMRCFFNSGFTFYLCFYCVGPTGHLRKNRHSGRPMVAPTNRFERGQSFCTLSAGSGALAVFSAAPIPGDRNKRIRRCGGSPLNYISQAGRIQEN